ncbi:MAG: ABC transporter substrate-binding protein [Acutalibacteraceae bacterium]
MKKILALVLVAVLCLSLFAACGKSVDGETTAADATSAVDETAAAAEDAFKIGSIGPLTGDAAIYGQAVMNGAQIAVDEINEKGEIKLAFQSQDDVSDAETSVNAYNKLVDWGMQILMGTVTTTPCIAVGAQTNTDRVFTLTPSASSTDVIDGKDNVFQVCFTDPNQGIASADYISENLAGKKVAIIYRNDDAYSQGIRDTFVDEATAKDVEVVYEGTFTKDTSTDFSAQLTGAQSAGAEIVFLPIYYQPASVILKQAADMGYEPTFFGVDGMDGILTMEGFDTTLAEGVMLLTPFSADAEDEATKNFVAKYKEKFNETPNQFAADGYDAIYIIATALKESGCTADMTAAEICEKLITVMPTITVDGITGEGMTWSDSGEVSKGPRAVVIENGVYVTPGK